MKVTRVTLRLRRDFVCGRCKKQADGFMDSVEEETVRGFCYLWDRLNAGGGCDNKSNSWLGEVVRVAQSQ